MKAVVITNPGDPGVLEVQEVEELEFKDDEVLVQIEAAALNRGDIYQRQGFYSPPEGVGTYPGLECSGIIKSVGENVSRWKVGDKENSEIDLQETQKSTVFNDTASLPEVACTVWSNVFMLCPGETLLIHGGSSGIGNEVKSAFCKDLGADVCINYKTNDFVARVRRNQEAKADAMNGFVAELNMGAMLAKRLSIQGTALGTSVEEKAAIVNEVEKNVWPAIISGKVKPVIYQQFPLGEAAEAHRLMESGNHIGKILLIP
ncbi:Beta-galactosidase 8 [Hibiscus syriacus]|uniref:Beta-galactosidase 8 n=1 Tax=Hibiscus syriacus TaxID=106335 RepID=A0A6A3ACA7_HIBSY|nr:Beta-galactosidase 8 [Hibiscus syriacus]